MKDRKKPDKSLGKKCGVCIIIRKINKAMVKGNNDGGRHINRE